MGVFVMSNNWMTFTNAVGDFNGIHRNDSVAWEYDLNKKIAPGMWLASHIEGRNRISGVKQIKFSGNVFDGDYFNIKKINGKPEEMGYEFRCKNKKVCDVRGVRFGNYEGPAKDLKEILYEHKMDIEKREIDNYWKSIHYSGDCGESFPSMYVASLLAPVLLKFGNEKGLSGFHASQSFQIHKDYCEGKISFLVGDRRDRGQLSFLELRGYQNGDMVISGRAGVVPS